METRESWVGGGSVRGKGYVLEFWNVRPGWGLRDRSSDTAVLILSDPTPLSHVQYFPMPLFALK